MSSHLVKKLLRASADDYNKHNGLDVERPKKRRRKEESAAASAPATKEQILSSRVRQMLAMDRNVATRKKSSKAVLRKMHKQQNEAKAIQKEASHAIVTNSRSSAAQALQTLEPTSNKRRYRKEKEEARLKDIARKLQQFTKNKK